MKTLNLKKARARQTKQGVTVYEINQTETFFDTVYFQVLELCGKYCNLKILSTRVMQVSFQFSKNGISIYLEVDNGKI